MASYWDRFKDSVLEGFRDGVDAIAEILVEYSPELDVRQGTALHELMIKPIGVTNATILQNLETLIDRLSLVNYETMAEADMDRIVSTIFIYRREGSKARGVVRIYFEEPLSVTVSTGVVAVDDLGQRFVAANSYSYPISEVMNKRDGMLYYVDIVVEAEEEGESYNIDAHKIISLEGLNVPWVKVDNLYAISSGLNRETNQELFTRSRDGLTSRTLAHKRGIRQFLFEKFDAIKDVVVIGYGDPEMQRDIARQVILDSRDPEEEANFFAKIQGTDNPNPHYLYKATLEEGDLPLPTIITLPQNEVSQDDYNIIGQKNLSHITYETNIIFQDDFGRLDDNAVGNDWVSGENDLSWGKELMGRECRVENKRLILGITTVTDEEEQYLNKWSANLDS